MEAAEEHRALDFELARVKRDLRVARMLTGKLKAVRFYWIS